MQKRFSISALIISIFAILASPIILVFLFGISWALADSGIQPVLSDYVLLYGLNSILYVLGLISIIFGIISILKAGSQKKGKAISISGIILGSVAIIIGVIITLLLIFYFI